MIESFTKENNDTNDDLKGKVAVINLEMMVKHEESGKTHLKENTDLNCGICSHTFTCNTKLKRHQQMFGHSS